MNKIAIFSFLAGLVSVSAYAQQVPGAHFLSNWDLNGDGSVSLGELRERRANVFLSFDANDDGFLDREEYVLFDETRAADAARNGHGTSGARRMQRGMTLQFNDVDKDGKVSATEFSARTEAWLSQADRNADGKITTADFGPRS